MNMSTSIPTQKVTAATIAAAVVQLIVYVTNAVFHENISIPPEVEGVLTTVIVFVSAYFIPPHLRDTLQDPGSIASNDTSGPSAS